MHYLSICAILKNEALYIKEWLDHHIKQGVEHFYLYNNESTDNVKEVIKPYENVITWHELKGTKQQRVAYDHCIETYRDRTDFCALIDLDEFLYSTADNRFVDTLSKRYDIEGVSGVAVHWLLFGSNGHLKYSPEDVRKRFTRRAASVNPHIKSIIRLKDAICMNTDPHSFIVKNTVINENFVDLPKEYALDPTGTAHVLRINHYATKSKEECDKKTARGRADIGMQHNDNFFEAHDCNDVEDLEIQKWT